ncbi:MAG TPA: transporter substrate-binding domain-containing protein [Dongiaceae bacterium]|jgi:ABC-type amino acid transport substrate-binding protein|nr:transporter substrate-binding domain-containing protein [Dongiaceae bacterium]
MPENTIPVPYPIDKGLIGYRVAMATKGRGAEIAGIDSLDKLRHFIVGRGTGWGDVRIFMHNGVAMETAAKYESLFKMLAGGRFDLFPRGVIEAPQELVMLHDVYPDLVIADKLLIKYRYAQFFYVSKSQPRLAARIKAGLEKMIADGSLDRLFDKHFGKTIAELNLDQRTAITLDNPFLPAWVPLDRKELWF